MSDSLFDAIGREAGEWLSPIVRVAQDPTSLDTLLASVGAIVPDAQRAALLASLTAIAALKTQLDGLLSQLSPSLDSISALLDVPRQTFAAVRALDDVAGSSPGLAGLGRDLANALLTAGLSARHPLFRSVAALAGLLELAEDVDPQPPVVQAGEILRGPFRVDRYHLDRLASLVRDPASALRAEYGNPLATLDDANAMAEKLFPRVQRVLRELGVTCRYGFDPTDGALLGDTAPFLDHALIVYSDDQLAGAATEAGIVFTLSSADRGDLGLVMRPFGTLLSTRTVAGWTIDSSLTVGVNVLAYGRHGLTLVASASAADVTGSIAATLAAPDDGPAFVVGARNSSRLEVGGAHLQVDTSLSEARQTLATSAAVSSAALVIAPGDGDGFLASLLPVDGLRAKFDLGLAWSSVTGLTLRGQAGLDATLPVVLSIAGVTLTSVHLGLQADDGRMIAEVSASLSASIGPVCAVLDRVGIAGALSFPQTGGNLGVADLALGFKPPSGIGLSVDAQGVVTGGGFLFHDDAQQLYAGVMQLSLHDALTVKAFGLIGTRMPDGSPGFSLLVFITAEDFQPIPLGLGFTLQGIGGMVAVNRTFDEAVLRAGMQNNTLRSLLFPVDPVANAPAIIRALASAFPARTGSYLMGVLVRIGWGTPTLILLDLALILEFGARQRLLALGRISALLPSPDNDLVRLNLDAIGVLDLDRGTVAIDAILVDSRLVHKFALTGAGALRAGGSGAGTGFVLAVGGFNPRFAPPTGVPSLARVAIALSSGNNPRLTCEAYFALTSNTVQFGARAQLHAEAYGFSVDGDIGFDVLISRAPLHFIADFHASVQLKHGSHNLFAVSLQGALEGPRPLRVSGKASFEIFWCDFTVRFDKTLIDGDPPPLPPAIDVLAQLLTALSNAQSWRTDVVANRTHGVALRKLAPGAALVIDPLGRLVVTQDVVPLNTARDIDLFGGSPVAGARRFGLGAMLNGVALTPPQTLQAAFAPAQFFDMTDDEKLASPSFEEMDAGMAVGSDAVTFDPAQLVAAPLEYESIVIDTLAPPGAPAPPLPVRYTLAVTQLQAQAATGAAARAPVRRTGRARFRTDAAPVVKVAQPRWTIVPIDSAPAVTVDPAVRTWSEHLATLDALNRSGALYQLVPA